MSRDARFFFDLAMFTLGGFVIIVAYIGLKLRKQSRCWAKSKPRALNPAIKIQPNGIAYVETDVLARRALRRSSR